MFDRLPTPDRPASGSGRKTARTDPRDLAGYPEITIEDAYAVQREWVRLKIAESRTLKGHKIGLTSSDAGKLADQRTGYGALLDDMFFHDGSDIPTDRFIVRVEVELAFVLAKPLRGPSARCSASTTPRTS